jgi:hypothetical protein
MVRAIQSTTASRADQVGSLLRPPALLQARQEYMLPTRHDARQ